jgi:hypothetical protein
MKGEEKRHFTDQEIANCMRTEYQEWFQVVEKHLQLKYQEQKDSIEKKRQWFKALPEWKRVVSSLYSKEIRLEDADLTLYSWEQVGLDNEACKDSDLFPVTIPIPTCYYGTIFVTFQKSKDLSSSSDHDSTHVRTMMLEYENLSEELKKTDHKKKRKWRHYERTRTKVEMDEDDHEKILDFLDLSPQDWEHYDGDRDCSTFRCEEQSDVAVFKNKELDAFWSWMDENEETFVTEIQKYLQMINSPP